MGLPRGRTNNSRGRPKKVKKADVGDEKTMNLYKSIDLFYDPEMIDFNEREMGGGLKYSVEIVNKFLSIIRIDGTIEEALLYAGISESTYTRWREKYPKFVEAVNRSKNFLKIAARNAIANEIINNGSAKDAWELLRRRDDRYIDKRESVEDKKLTLTEGQYSLIFGKLNKMKEEGKLNGYIEGPKNEDNIGVIDAFNENKQTIFDYNELNKDSE